jgi:hypothetical protein
MPTSMTAISIFFLAEIKQRHCGNYFEDVGEKSSICKLISFISRQADNLALAYLISINSDPLRETDEVG